LRDKVALVTGGGTGLGRAICSVLAQAGAALAVNFQRSGVEASETVEAIRAAGGVAETVRADVSKGAEVDQLISWVTETFGRLDVLVNAAGVTTWSPFSELDALGEDDWDRIMAVNVKGVWLTSRAGARPMRRQGSGVIVNVASTAGLVPAGSSLPYSVSKAGVIHLTKCLAVALQPTVRVNAVAPGLMLTRWNAGLSEAAHERYLDRTLLRQTIPVDHVASVVLELATNTSLTGQVWAIDAGFTVR